MIKVLCVLFTSILLSAQTSPEVHPDRSVTFRVAAPKASDVRFYGDWMKVGSFEKMTRGADGVWAYTTAPLEPSIYIYSFTIDGLTIADPINPRMKLRARTSASMVEVPGATPAIWDARDVPHGAVSIEFQKAKALGGETRSFWVYTPPGYETAKTKYPVLYLFHGSNDTAGGWVLAGQANYIFDNLLAEGKMKPMVVVMPFGHAVPFGSPREVQATNTAVYEKYVLGDVLPYVEAKYRVSKAPAQRAIAGLSMGGGQALSIGLGHPALFSAVGAFSAAVPANVQSLIEKGHPKLIWFACGKEDSLFPRSVDLDALLTRNTVPHTWKPSEGAHTYTVWRKYLAEFAPLLFR
ncbi:esterase [Bryobacter aggregatus]|uniref:esterase n=1 Tax=Bryobacter aggregatus TaxID=360054 RepID=UPI0004E0ECD5|nr:esterase [Bryobacter aggregatus]